MIEVLSYELVPLPFSLYGELRKGNKSALMNRLSVQSSSANEGKQPDVELIDGDALLYHIQWPKASTVAQCAASFIKSVPREHQVCHI